MIGDELAIEQREAADPQSCDEMGERDLGGIGYAAEHALAEKGAAERDAIKPADQRAANLTSRPDLDRMGMTVTMEDAVSLFDLRVDPGFRTSLGRFRATFDDTREGAIGGHGKAIGAQRFAQRMREMEAVQR
jgi:hypothetical protein